MHYSKEQNSADEGVIVQYRAVQCITIQYSVLKYRAVQ